MVLKVFSTWKPCISLFQMCKSYYCTAVCSFTTTIEGCEVRIWRFVDLEIVLCQCDTGGPGVVLGLISRSIQTLDGQCLLGKIDTETQGLHRESDGYLLDVFAEGGHRNAVYVIETAAGIVNSLLDSLHGRFNRQCIFKFGINWTRSVPRVVAWATAAHSSFPRDTVCLFVYDCTMSYTRLLYGRLWWMQLQHVACNHLMWAFSFSKLSLISSLSK